MTPRHGDEKPMITTLANLLSIIDDTFSTGWAFGNLAEIEFTSRHCPYGQPS
jgi:hypothetical protein